MSIAQISLPVTQDFVTLFHERIRIARKYIIDAHPVPYYDAVCVVLCSEVYRQ